MKQYCRYCINLAAGNGTWCEKRQKEMSDSTAKRVNHCKDFDFCEIDAFGENLDLTEVKVLAMIYSLCRAVGRFLFVLAAPCPVSIGKVDAVPTILFHAPAFLSCVMPAPPCPSQIGFAVLYVPRTVLPQL